MRGYFGIGVYRPKTQHNVGTLWRSAHAFGASMLFVIGARYRRQSSDTVHSALYLPFFEHETLDAFLSARPWNCPLIGIELADASIALPVFSHPERAIYLLGAEDNGLPPSVLERCNAVTQIPGRACINVAAAGSIVMYDRVAKATR
jgi:tRNA G18 (ribose-2'-O)-methylase SpoU